MRVLVERRREMGLSQRELARRAGLAYKTVQLIEKDGRGSRWSTLGRLAKALGLSGPEAFFARSAGAALSAAETADRMRRAGEGSWRIPFFEFVDAFRGSPRPGIAAKAPDTGAGPRALALLAGAVERLSAERGISPPWWCAGVGPLEEPWFVSETENLKAAALAESPAEFRKRNIFVLENFLFRA